MKCRYCGEIITNTFIDLYSAPAANLYLTSETLHLPEKWFPLRVMVCDNCWLVQTEDYIDAANLFSNSYAYFSSFSTSWLNHINQYVNKVTEEYNLGENSLVIEIAANDGYMLQFFLDKKIPCYGIEPTKSTANVARKKGIRIIDEFFSVKLAKKLLSQGLQADLMPANNVLAHVPDINDFVKAFSILLKKDGVASFEFPHLLNLIKYNQFDTIYHEHFSYLSLSVVDEIFRSNGLQGYDVEELATHGGSLRVYAQKLDSKNRKVTVAYRNLINYEKEQGINKLSYYHQMKSQVEKVKIDLLLFLLNLKKKNKKIIAYGAAAKGNTLLNFFGIKNDLISLVVDKNPNKQNLYMPGSRIPIVDESVITKYKPDYVLILPWNIKTEISQQLSYIRSWGGKFVTAIPILEEF